MPVELNERPKAQRRRWLTVRMCVWGSLGAFFLVVFVWVNVEGYLARRPREFTFEERVWGGFHSLTLRLLVYYRDHGAFPYDPRGAEYALYNLPPAGPHPWSMAPFHYDDVHQKVVDMKYDYANPPPEELSSGSAETIVLAYKLPPHEGDRIYYFTSHGNEYQVKLPVGFADRHSTVVGLTHEELVGGGCEVLSTDRPLWADALSPDTAHDAEESGGNGGN